MSTFTIMFQSLFSRIDSSTTSNNICYFDSDESIVFYYDGTNKKYQLRDVVRAVDLISISGNDALTLNDHYKNNLIPFSMRLNGSRIYLDTPLSSYSASTSLNPDTSTFDLYFGKHLSYNTITGTYANIKYFKDFKDSITSYFRNPHARYEENQMLFDYKLYDSPSGNNALNSYTLSAPGTISVSFTGNPSYDLFPVNFKRDFNLNGGLIPGGDFVKIDSDSKKRGSSNFGYGLFSAEAINNDILDYYGSSSATNISSFYADPQSYYDHDGLKIWKHLDEHRSKVISKERYPNGIDYSKFIGIVSRYKHVLNNFFKTADQFIRFKSKIIQKGVNIEPTLLDRSKHAIKSSLTTVRSNSITFTHPQFYFQKIEQKNISLSGIRRAFVDNNFENKIASISGYKRFYASSTESKKSSLTGYKSVFSTYSGMISQNIGGTLIDDIAHKGIVSSDRKYDINNNRLSKGISKTKTKKSINAKTIYEVNKNVIETSEDIVTPFSGILKTIVFQDPSFSGGATKIDLTASNAYIKGFNLYSNFEGLPFSATGNRYFVAAYNSTIPLTGIYTSTSVSGSSASGQMQAEFLKYNFKDFGVDTQKSYFRKYAKISLKIENDGFISDNNYNVFDISSQIDKNFQTPVFQFYCYNNDTYYTDRFQIPLFSKDGTQILVAINPIFSGMTLGLQNITIKNNINGDLFQIPIDVVENDDNTKSRTGDGGSKSLNRYTQSVELSALDVSNGFVIFATGTSYDIDLSLGVTIFVNGIRQDQFTFWNFEKDGLNNKIIFDNTAVIAGDTITIEYSYK